LLKKIKLPLIKDLPLFIISGFVGFSFYAYSFNIGSITTSSSLSSIIISTAPIITALFASIFLKERLNTFCGVALTLEFIGILIIFSVDKIFQIEIGVLWISLSSISLAIFNIIQRPLLKKYTPTQVTIYSIIFASIMLSIFAKKSINEIKTANFYQILNVVCLGVIP
jgi:drug/metabolite transporter (DMT)-like permease